MRRFVLVATTLLATILAACGGGTATTTGTAAAGGTLAETLSEFKYSKPALELKAGETATLELKNAGSVEHDFTIDAVGLHVALKAGESTSRKIGPFQPGTYTFYCSVPGHKEAGMKGQLIVK